MNDVTRAKSKCQFIEMNAYKYFQPSDKSSYQQSIDEEAKLDEEIMPPIASKHQNLSCYSGEEEQDLECDTNDDESVIGGGGSCICSSSDDEPIVGKNGAKYMRHGGFCLNTQSYPDAVNHVSCSTYIH